MKKYLIILIIILFTGCVATAKWFRTYVEDVEYYEYLDLSGNTIIVTDNELDSIVLSDFEWLQSHRLNAIVFKK